jgi:hypothetical protein
MIARGTGYIRGPKEKALSRLVAHLRYLEREAATKGVAGKEQLFSENADQMSRKEAIEHIMARATLARVRYHKLVLSPAANEPIKDWQAWTRAVMAELQQHLGAQLTWTAIKHTNTAHPHVHVVLAGSGPDLQTGAARAVRLHLSEYQLLRQSGLSHSEQSWYRQLAGFASQGADELGALLPGELRVSTYGELSRAGKRGDNLTPHHIPSAEYMQARGVAYERGVAINVEHPGYGAGRHRLTRTYGWRNITQARAPETPRQALARDVWDLRRIYATQGHHLRQPLREVIEKNKVLYPDLFRKEAQP